MKVLICGGRAYDNREYLEDTLDNLEISEIIEGGATGADALAYNYAKSRNIKVTKFVANWKKYGRKAGMLRNKQMLEEGKPDLVIAFPGNKGTANMIKLAKWSKIPILDLSQIGPQSPINGR